MAVAALVLGLLALAGCGDTYRWNQRLTVTVDTPQGEVSGSSVSAVKWTEGGNWSMGFNYNWAAEAVIVALPRGKYLFAANQHFEHKVQNDGSVFYVSNSEWVGSVAPASIAQLAGRPLRVDLFREVASKSGRAAGLINVPPYQYPVLVTFKDLKNPKSALEIDPNDLAATFGPGYRLKSITLEVTTDPPTVGQIEKLLPWLPELKAAGSPLDGSRPHSTIRPVDPFLRALGWPSFSYTNGTF